MRVYDTFLFVIILCVIARSVTMWQPRIYPNRISIGYEFAAIARDDTEGKVIAKSTITNCQIETYHFLNITKTANTISPKPTKWFHPKRSVLKNTVVKIMNTVNVIAS